MLSLTDPITLLSGVGPARAGQLEALGIETIQDLLYHIPFRYEPIPDLTTIANLEPDKESCIHGTVISKSPVKLRFKRMIKVQVEDETGKMSLTWFNTDFVLSAIQVGQSYYFTGKVALFANKPTMVNPAFQAEAPVFGSLIPIYHETANLTSKYLSKLVHAAWEQIELADDPNMNAVYERQKLPSLQNALDQLHVIAPTSKQANEPTMQAALRRLAFDEMFFLIKNVMEHKKEHERTKPTVKLAASNKDIAEFAKLLPYAPTQSQKEALQAICLDMVQNYPMYRLLQGEVGSGKTTVAAFALWLAAKQGHKAFLVCPTNILASQHFETLRKLLTPPHHPELGSGSREMSKQVWHEDLSIGLYTGTEKNPDADILIGTHALFNRKSTKPALVVVDEEHRFGVGQREMFLTGKKRPHYLSMTATPIPRTVALTVLADRDVSFITPHKSNSNIKTWVVPHKKRTGAYNWIKKTLQETGGQALVVCPFIESSSVDTLATVKSAKKEFEAMGKIFTAHRLALLHGKMKAKEKDNLFADMMARKTDILVTTPVVEVGVDIPKANIIIIEGAERFGLAQLHQLRGRVGRRGQEAFCLLFTSEGLGSSSPQQSNHAQLKFPISNIQSDSLKPDTPARKALHSDAGGLNLDPFQKRLAFFASSYDGNALAEYDLRHRGSGELLGVRQHGFDSLRFASWFDTELIEKCKEEVEWCIIQSI